MSIIKSLSVGNGDMFYIKHDTDSFSIIDCCMNEDRKENIVKELKKQSSEKGIFRFISTHPDDDHIRGLQYLNQEIKILNFYTVENQATKEDETDDFKEYCNLRNSRAFHLKKECSRKWLNDSDKDRGSAGIDILWPIVSNEHYKKALKVASEGGSPNNISPIIQYSENDAKVLWMGDLETDFMENIEDDVILEKIDILFAPHHGRDSGKVPKSWLDRLDPEIIIIGEAPSKDLNYYQGFNTIKQNSAGDLLFDCLENEVRIYVEFEAYTEDFLDNNNHESDEHDLYYLGTLTL